MPVPGLCDRTGFDEGRTCEASEDTVAGAPSARPGAGRFFGVWAAALAAFPPVGVSATRCAACRPLACVGFVAAA